MKKVIGVMGPGEKQATPDDLACAFEIGKRVAKHKAVLLCGGMSGVMESSAKGAQSEDGLTVGIGPTQDKADMNNSLDIALLTGMGPGRNFMNVLSSDVLVFVSVGSPGALSELAFAIQMEKPSIVIRGSEKLKAYIEECSVGKVHFVDSLEDLDNMLRKLL